MFDIDIIDDRARFTALRGEWTELLASSRADGLFLTWEWLHTWWSHLGEGRTPFIVTLRFRSKLVAVAPLMSSRSWPRRYEFLGTGSVGSDYLDFIIDRAYERVATEALVAILAQSRMPLRLPSVKTDSIVASTITKALGEAGWRVRSVAMQVCPYITLSSWDSYLNGLGASHRYNFRRRLRGLEKTYAFQFERAESKEDCDQALQHVVRLHLQRWNARGGSDGLHEERLIAFHRAFSALALERGWLRLRLLKLGEDTVGAFYGFRYNDKFLFYQSGFDERFAKASVGLVMLGLTIKDAIEEGASEYDFLHGDESYKFLWARDVRPLSRIELYPPGVVGGVHRQSVIAVAATKKIVRRALDAPLNR